MKKYILASYLSLLVLSVGCFGCHSEQESLPPLPSAEQLDIVSDTDSYVEENESIDDFESTTASTSSDEFEVSEEAGASEDFSPITPFEKKFLSSEDLTDQISLLVSHISEWKQSSETEKWEYMVTDLDFNGRLEIVAATCNGTGLYTSAKIYEVSENLSGLSRCTDNLAEGDDFTDIEVSTTNLFFDESAGCYRFVFTNLCRESAAEHFESMDTLSLSNGKITIQNVATITSKADDLGLLDYSYKDSEGNEITEEQYYTALNTYYPHMSDISSCSFEWITVTEEGVPAKLANSYQTFLKQLK